MAFIIKDRVKENTTTTGTGAITLGGAAATFDTFQSYMVNGDTTYYAIVSTETNTDEWEVGLGTWNTGNTLTRTTVLAGSNGTNAVNFGSGSKDIFMTYPAAHAALAGDDVDFANITVSGTVDGRDVASDGTKLDTIEQNADVTDAVNVAAAGALMKSGGTMTGNLILNADPTTALGAATKEYVDTIAAAGIHYHTPVRVEAPSALSATYDNGSSGVGATLTNAGTQAALVIDGVTLSTSDRVLVYNQTNAAHNGIYTVTNTGSSSTNWVLTRATDADSYGVSDPDAFGEGDAFFVKEGDTGAGELYVMNTSGTITFGTTAITFTVIAETAVYSAGTGMSLTGTTFSIGQDVGTTDNVTFNQVTAAIIGNVTGNVTGNVSGNAGTATKLATARTIQLSGDVTGSATFDGSANINITAAVQDDSHAHVISNVDGLQSALDDKTDTTRTLTAGNGLTGGGDLSANRTFNVGAGAGITVGADTVAHADTSTQSSVNNSGRTYIQDITLDGFGHVTGLTSATETVTNTNQLTTFVVEDGDGTEVTISQGKEWKFVEGGGIDINWTDTSTGSDGDPYDLTIKHVDTSSQASVNNSNGVVIQDVTLDTYGHVTGLGSVDLDGRYVNVTGDTMTGNLVLSSTGSIGITINADTDNAVSEQDLPFLTMTQDGGLGNLTFGIDNNTPYIYPNRTDVTDQSSAVNQINLKYKNGTYQQIFHDDYHPNADKWTTARSHTVTLTGDVTGTATQSVDGTGNRTWTISTTVGNDSHTHSWPNITSGTRSNYNLKLKPANTNDFGGFQFLKSDNNNAGYFLVAGSGRADDGTYKPNGITLVSDGSWLSLVQRNTTSGIRFATSTGSPAIERLRIESSGRIEALNVVDVNDNDIVGIGRLNFNNHEGTDYGVTGDVMFDENFYNDTEYGSASIWPGANGGGLAVYNEDGWGRILTDRNMKWANGNFAGMTIGATSAAPHNAGGLQIAGSTGEKIVMSGNNDPYIRWQEGTTDRFYIQWTSSNDAPLYRNQQGQNHDFRGNNGVRLRLRDDAGNIRGYVHANTSNNVGFLDAGDHWAVRHINDNGTYFYTDNGTEEFRLGRDAVTGSYGTVETKTTKNSYGGYSINGQWVFMSNGAGLSGIYNDTNDEWAIIARQNAEVELYHNGSLAMETIGAGGIRVGSTTSSDIYMQDTDHGERRIHCNSNQLGFLDSSSQWSFWSNDAGDINSVRGANFGSATLTADGQNDVFMFASGPTSGVAQAGAFHNKLRILGGSGQSRDLQFYQQDSEYAHIGSSWTGNQLTIDSAFTQVNCDTDIGVGSSSYRIALSTGGLRANSSVGHTASSDEGIFWHTDSNYSIHRTAGSWSSPSYQQLEINWPTGIKIVTSAAGTYTYSYLDVQAQINANHSDDQKIVLTGSSNPYIRFQEGTTNRAYIQWVSSQDALMFRNQQTDNFDFMPDASTGAVNLRLRGSDNDIWGSVYADDNSNTGRIGFLDDDQNWAYRHTSDSLHEWMINNTVEMSLSTSTLDLKNNTITNVEDIYLNDRIYHNGDTNTYLQFEANDVFRIVIAGAELQEWGNNYTRLNDNDTLRLGSGSDFRMWHNGTDTYFRNYHHGGGDMLWQGENTSGVNHAILYMQCDTARTYVKLFENSEERLRTTSTGITVYGDVNSTSDIRYKKNVETIDNAVDKVKALRGVTFDWDNEAFEASGEEVQKPSFSQRATGVIAQDVEKVLPEAVREDAETGFKNVSYGNMVGLLIEAIKEQQEQIDMLTQKLNEVENK